MDDFYSPVTLCGVDHRQTVLALNAKFVLCRLKVSLKGVNASNVEPHILLEEKDTGCYRRPCDCWSLTLIDQDLLRQLALSQERKLL